MTTTLDATMKREVRIDGNPYTLTLTDAGFTLAGKGRRKGMTLRWSDLVNGDAALAAALNAAAAAPTASNRRAAVVASLGPARSHASNPGTRAASGSTRRT